MRKRECSVDSMPVAVGGGGVQVMCDVCAFDPSVSPSGLSDRPINHPTRRPASDQPDAPWFLVRTTHSRSGSSQRASSTSVLSRMMGFPSCLAP